MINSFSSGFLENQKNQFFFVSKKSLTGYCKYYIFSNSKNLITFLEWCGNIIFLENKIIFTISSQKNVFIVIQILSVKEVQE